MVNQVEICKRIKSGERPFQIMRALGIDRKSVMLQADKMGVRNFKRGRPSGRTPAEYEKANRRSLRLLKLKRSMTYRQIADLEGVSYQCVQQWISALVPKPPKGERCKQCGKIPRERLHRHHVDYSNPEKIEYLCLKCHALEHGKEIRKSNLERLSKLFSGKRVCASALSELGFTTSQAMAAGLRVERLPKPRRKYPEGIINWTLPPKIIMNVWGFPTHQSVWTTRARFDKSITPAFRSNAKDIDKNRGLIEAEFEKEKRWRESGGFGTIRKQLLSA